MRQAQTSLPLGTLPITLQESDYETLHVKEWPAERASKRNTFVYVKGSEMFEMSMNATSIELENYEYPIPQLRGDVLCRVDTYSDKGIMHQWLSDLSRCQFGSYLNLMVAVGCLRESSLVDGLAYFWTRGMTKWLHYGDAAGHNPTHVAGAGCGNVSMRSHE